MAKQAKQAKSSGGGFANLSKNDQIKLISASSILVIAVVWIAYTLLSGEAKVVESPAVIAETEQEAEVEQVKIRKNIQDTSRGRPPVISGS